MKKIVIASGNKSKIKEFAEMLVGYEVIGSKQLGVTEEIEETGETFYDNALIKAKYVAEKLGVPALADDSGLMVDALGGEPGVYSARYAGGHDDKANNAIETEGIDNRVMLMYGVPMPDGSFPTPMPNEQPQIVRPGVPFPDGRRAIEMTEERAAEIMEMIKTEEAAKAEIVKEIDGVPFPDGRVAIVMTEERAAEILEMIKAEEAAKDKK